MPRSTRKIRHKGGWPKILKRLFKRNKTKNKNENKGNHGGLTQEEITNEYNKRKENGTEYPLVQNPMYPVYVPTKGPKTAHV